MRKYEIDLDYNQFPIPDLTLDLHWIHLPHAVYAEKEKAEYEQQLAALPKEHKIILVPADPHESPAERELWPLVNHAVLQCLEPHPELRSEIRAAVRKVVDEHRGWRNPFPVTPKPAQNKISKNEPGHLVQNKYDA